MTVTTVLFLDLSRFTALTDVHGDHAAIDVADRFIAAARSAVEANSGRLLKTLGDGAPSLSLTTLVPRSGPPTRPATAFTTLELCPRSPVGSPPGQ